MSILVNPHNSEEEQALLAFLDSMKYEYTMENELSILSEAQQQEILERDGLYEAGQMKSYSLEEVITHFNIKEK